VKSLRRSGAGRGRGSARPVGRFVDGAELGVVTRGGEGPGVSAARATDDRLNMHTIASTSAHRPMPEPEPGSGRDPERDPADGCASGRDSSTLPRSVFTMRSPALKTPLLVAFLTLLGCDRRAGIGPEASPSASVSASTAWMPAPPATFEWDPAARTAAVEAGKAVITKHQCTRCHTIDDLPEADRPLHCTSCHTFLKTLSPSDRRYQKLAQTHGEATLQRYQKNIDHLREVPNLTGIGRRVRSDWIVSFLREPYDVRPALEDSMFRHRMSEAEIQTVVRYFAAVAEAKDPASGGEAPSAAAPSAERVEAGKKLFLTRGCVACHTFGNVPTGVTTEQLMQSGAAAKLAPNLRFVKERTRPDALVAWMVAPQSLAKDTAMPALGLSREEAETIRDFLLAGDPALSPAPPVVTPPAPAKLDREVTYEEMKERVLGKVCVHCHMNDYEKDPGPGNRGGMGYSGVQLSMRTYETLVNGAVDAGGHRYSVLTPKAGETSAPIVQAMMRRRAEEPRDHVRPFADHERPHYPAATPGMPMSLPSMKDEEIAILVTWIAEGCPGPTAVSGKAGMDDGFLVPDGPIRKNHGCELRAPDAKRPAWAVDAKPSASAAPR
jgi:mono/diheme cytochrome c family protein